ncbi:MAG: relaxase/mobilization nuclease domain-containing protein [bacterium]|nr:relaxase/mobilization nuclease domain-containing protein [bacterium]
MIGKVTRGRGFKGLLTYLLQGQDGQQQDRVAWVATRNLVVDPEFAPSVMHSTAAENPRVEKPVYHLSISLDPQERLEPEVLRGVAERTLRDLGLEHHQAVLVAHEDTEHQHVHVMVNRVDPTSRKAWRAGHDYARIEKSLRLQERELGLRQVRGRHFSLDGGDRHREARASSGSRRLAERTRKQPFGEHVRAVARRDMLEARTWGELHDRLGEVGLRLEKRGRGLVVTDGGERVKASFVDRKASLASLERRLATYEPSRRNFPAGKSERWRQIQALRTVVDDLARRTEAKRSRRAERFHQQSSQRSQERLEGRIRAASAAFDQRLEEVYRDPRKARQAFEKAVRRHGERRALGQLARDPEKLGKLRGRGGPFASTERWAAIEAGPHAASAARSVLSARALRKAPLSQKVARRVRDAGRTSARQLKRTAAKLLKHVGWTLAARALTAPQYQLLKLTLRVGSRALDVALDRQPGGRR